MNGAWQNSPAVLFCSEWRDSVTDLLRMPTSRANPSRYTKNDIAKLNKWGEKLKMETYLIPHADLEGSAYFEFQKGEFNKKIGIFRRAKMEFKLADSLFLDCEDGETLMEAFSFFLPGFDLCYIGYPIKRPHGEILINQLRKIAKLIESGNNIPEALEAMGVYDPKSVKTAEEISKITHIPKERISLSEDRYKLLELPKVQNTANQIADWLEEVFKIHDTVSILGL